MVIKMAKGKKRRLEFFDADNFDNFENFDKESTRDKDIVPLHIGIIIDEHSKAQATTTR